MAPTPFKKLHGKKIVKVEGLEVESDCVTFTFHDGTKGHLKHEQDCCESVSLYEFDGDADILTAGPILYALEEFNSRAEPRPDNYAESWTWTFYRIITIGGTVTMRWLGESNGYYGEEVSLYLEEQPDLLSFVGEIALGEVADG